MENKNEVEKVALFNGQKIRRVLFNDEWWFSVVDVVRILVNSAKPSIYWTVMKTRITDEDKFQSFTICKQLKLVSSDGKKYATDCANTEERKEVSW